MDKIIKIQNLLPKIKKAIEDDNYLYTGHANQRLQLREVTRQEVKQVLISGYHEKKKDTYDEAFLAWNYAIRGKTIDSKELRVIISFHEDNMLVITVIDLGRLSYEN